MAGVMYDVGVLDIYTKGGNRLQFFAGGIGIGTGTGTDGHFEQS
jgi:hypothetical protein